jgi:hypothetical protein
MSSLTTISNISNKGTDMKRDMALILEILKIIENTDAPARFSKQIMQQLYVKGVDYDSLKHHVQLLMDEKFLRHESVNLLAANSMDGTPALKFKYDALTMAGHDFANLLNRPDYYEKLKTDLKDAPFKTVVNVAQHLLKKQADKYLNGSSDHPNSSGSEEISTEE